MLLFWFGISGSGWFGEGEGDAPWSFFGLLSHGSMVHRPSKSLIES